MADLRHIEKNLHQTDKQLAEYFGSTERAVCDVRHRYGIKRERNNYRFPKGMTPHNKGKKITDYLSADAIRRLHETRIKSNRARRKYNIGDVYWYPYHGIMCIMLEGIRRYNYAKYVWEQAHGVKLGKTTGMIHLDGNKRNCALENLRPETSSERIKRVVPSSGKYKSKAIILKPAQETPYQFYNPYKQSA